jgi:hypothetical protein
MIGVETVCFKVKNLVVWAGSEISGFAFANKLALNPKHEIRNSEQYKLTKILNIRNKTVNIYRQILILCFGHLNIRNSNLFRVSKFDIRI